MYNKITISGKICTGKSSVFRELQKQLDWPTFASGACFREYAKTHNLVLNNAEEQTNKLTQKVDGMVKVMLQKPGNLLLDAWLGGVLAEGAKDVLKVLLVAKDVVRFKRFAKRENVSLAEAKKEVLLRDSSWFEKVKKIHKRSDFFDEKQYTLVIDTSHVNIEYVVSTILKSLS
ncbi:MAG: cytidylate kinase family protein [bacterium]